METHEIIVNGQHAATVNVKSPVELLDHVATVRKVWESAPKFTMETEPGWAYITSRPIRIR